MRRCLVLLAVLLTIPVSILPPTPALAEQGPIRFVALTPDASIKVNGTFPPRPELCPARQPGSLNAAYRGVLEVGRRANGQLYLVTELTFPEYLNGIAEVPRSWPPEALKAQVVAARTYAISHMNPSTALAKELRYNLCSTDACQVFRGLNVERGAWGAAWSQAVADTQGEVLQYNGTPASTFYFSTSNGHTYSNTDAFGGAPLPYLKPVTETDDTQSPTSSWSVRMPLTDLAGALRLAKAWSGGAITKVEPSGDNVTISGDAAPPKTMALTELRNDLNAQAVCLTPRRYPTAGSDGNSLPQVIPSKWATVQQQGADMVIAGRGWGHGVGMVQWGLKGKAEKGMSYADMLAFYYGGLRPERVAEPDKIRVSLATDLKEITIERNGSVSVEGAAVPDGPIKITGGAAMTIAAAPPIPPRLRIESVSAAADPASPASQIFGFNLSAPANVRVELTGPQSSQLPAQPFDRGPSGIRWDLSSAGLASGSYQAALVANDGVDEVRSAPVSIAYVAPSPSPEPSPSPSPSPAPSPKPSSSPRAPAPKGPSPILIGGIGAVAVLLLIAGAILLRARLRT